MTRATAGTEIIAKAIHLACRAPSLHNSRPWRWIVGEGAVDLLADHERVVRSADRSGREAIISCGAALDHFRIAMAAAGWKTNVDPPFPARATATISLRSALPPLLTSPTSSATAPTRY
jgi:nitroreductase